MDVKFDIFRKLPDGQPVWVKAVEGLEETKRQLTQLAAELPGDYFIFDMRNGRKIAAKKPTVTLPERSLSARAAG